MSNSWWRVEAGAVGRGVGPLAGAFRSSPVVSTLAGAFRALPLGWPCPEKPTCVRPFVSPLTSCGGEQ